MSMQFGGRAAGLTARDVVMEQAAQEQAPRQRSAAQESSVTRSNLDLMRAIAVSTVLIDHTAISLGHKVVGRWDLGSLGVFGVYLFFVHTCLVLMWSLERRPHTLDFYVRRVFRIYPLAVVTIAIIVVFRLPFYPVQALTARVLISNLLLVQDMVHGTFNVVSVLWSLPLEVHMYLLLPMLFLYARREMTLWPFLLLWGFAMLLAYATYGLTTIDNVFLTVVPHFLPGVMAYIAYKRFRPRLPSWSFPLLLAVCCFFYMLHPTPARGWVACLVIGLSLPRFHELRQPVVARAAHEVAKYSYGIYLLHPLVLIFAFGVLRAYPVWLKLGTLLVGVGVVSTLAYHLIEHPLMRVGSRVANKMQTRFGTSYGSQYGLDLT